MAQRYTDEDFGIRMELPDGWRVAENKELQLVLTAPIEDGFSANMTFQMQSLDPPTPQGLQAVIDSARAERETEYKGFELLEQEKIRVDEFPSYWEVYNRITDEDETQLTQLFALILTDPEALFTLHCTSLHKNADTYIKQFKQIIQSFEFLDDD